MHDNDDAQLHRAVMNSIICASASGILVFTFKPRLMKKLSTEKYDPINLANGILIGLVTATPACAYLDPWAALIAGILSGILYMLLHKLFHYLKIDDPMEAS